MLCKYFTIHGSDRIRFHDVHWGGHRSLKGTERPTYAHFRMQQLFSTKPDDPKTPTGQPTFVIKVFVCSNRQVNLNFELAANEEFHLQVDSVVKNGRKPKGSVAAVSSGKTCFTDRRWRQTVKALFHILNVTLNWFVFVLVWRKANKN